MLENFALGVRQKANSAADQARPETHAGERPVEVRPGRVSAVTAGTYSVDVLDEFGRVMATSHEVRAIPDLALAIGNMVWLNFSEGHDHPVIMLSAATAPLVGFGQSFFETFWGAFSD